MQFAIQNNTPILVHKICRRNFTDKKRSLKASETNSHPSHEPQRKRLRSSIEVCDLKSQCFFCGKKSPTEKKNAERNTIHIVTFVEVHINILEKCHRRNDTWGDEVYIRLSCSNDLVADKGRYYKTCLQRFMTDKISPDLEDEENREIGRPADAEMLHWFEMLCIWLEIDSYSTNTCSCKKHGLVCVSACGNCNGIDCENCGNEEDMDDFSDKEDGSNIFDVFDN